MPFFSLIEYYILLYIRWWLEEFTCSDLFFQCSVWVARKPPGFAFIDFDDRRDAQDAIRELDGNNQGCLFFIRILKRLPFAVHLLMINLLHFVAMGSFVKKNMALLNYFQILIKMFSFISSLIVVYDKA